MNFKKYNFNIFIIMCLFGCSDIKSEHKYYETGELFSVTEYMDGLKNGKATFFYKNGDTMETQKWANGVKAGEAIKYYESGKIKYISEYLKDTIKFVKSYDIDGLINYKQRFDDKGLLTHQFEYDSSGNLKDTTPWLELEPRIDTLSVIKHIVLKFMH